MRSRPAPFACGAVAVALAATLAVGCSSGSGSGGAKAPLLIGASLSLTGDFSDDGQAYEKGYELWAHDVNAHGGLLGRKVQMVILNDNSSPTQVDTNYTDLITVHHVALTFGPFSTLLTAPAAEVAHRYGFAFVEGAGGGPLVFGEKLPNVFDVSLPVANELDPLVDWIKSLPASERPASAAYPMADDPFATPQVQLAQSELQPLGIKTKYSKIFPEEVPDYKPNADLVAASGAQMVVLGSTDVPTVSSFMQAFEQQHFNPKVFVAAAGPDQGAAFTSAVGLANANGVMVPDAWYPGYASASSQHMVSEYVAKYGGTASDVNADVAEAYSVGEVTAAAVEATGGTTGSKLITYLHSGVTLASVQGPVKFNSLGENVKAIAFIFQWQNGKFVQVLPAAATGSAKIINPKPAWSS
ncbi:MAG TPA: amino acid ABC transporter substrate-binding protein [Streptosporangiaceae bacterium]|jgi:branched-chain amino acid transport system substrate-binding protein|nr:amino acid ABC transporter substrate-binding protein [Streptosporangiaceae bacterium]